AGTIGISRISEGALVSPADPAPLAIIQQIDQVYVDIKRPAELGPLSGGEGEEATVVTLLSSEGEVCAERARVLFSDLSVDPGTGETTVRALAENPDGQLLPGMYLRARVPRADLSDALLVPQQAVLRPPTGAQVLVLGEGDKVEARSVTVQRDVEGRAPITRGLSAGDRVVVEGQARATPGALVRPLPWEAPAPATD